MRLDTQGLSGAAIATLGAEWRALFDRIPDATPFQSWEWVSSCWYEAGEGRPWILCARRGGELVGVLPLVLSSYRGLPVRRVSFLGAPLSDYQELLALPEERDACREAFVAHLELHSSRWDLIDLTDVPADGTLAQLALSGAHPRHRLTTAHHRICPYVPLPASWEVYRDSLGKSLRDAVGRKRRKLEKELGARLELVGEGQLASTLESLFELHDRRWRKRGLSGAFANPAVRRVHQRVAPMFLKRGWLRLHRLTTGGATRAVFYCFQRSGRVYYYLSGFDLELERLSIGSIVLGQVIADGIAGGAHELDFLRGNESYKYQWKAVERRTLRLIVSKPTFGSSVALGINRIEREAEQLGTRLRNRLWGATRASRT